MDALLERLKRQDPAIGSLRISFFQDLLRADLAGVDTAYGCGDFEFSRIHTCSVQQDFADGLRGPQTSGAKFEARRGLAFFGTGQDHTPMPGVNRQ